MKITPELRFAQRYNWNGAQLLCARAIVTKLLCENSGNPGMILHDTEEDLAVIRDRLESIRLRQWSNKDQYTQARRRWEAMRK